MAFSPLIVPKRLTLTAARCQTIFLCQCHVITLLSMEVLLDRSRIDRGPRGGPHWPAMSSRDPFSSIPLEERRSTPWADRPVVRGVIPERAWNALARLPRSEWGQRHPRFDGSTAEAPPKPEPHAACQRQTCTQNDLIRRLQRLFRWGISPGGDPAAGSPGQPQAALLPASSACGR